ncbi:MAG: DUF222 domain-containing protein [Acidimicrobiales bacterium]
MTTATAVPVTGVRDRLRMAAQLWARSQYELVVLAAELAVSGEWVLDGAVSAVSWLSAVAGVEPATAREWIRVGRRLQDLPASAEAFARGELSYAKVRILTRVATPDTERDLVDLAATVPAAELGRAIAAWRQRHGDDGAIERHQHSCRSVRWRTDPDGMVSFSARLPPLAGAHLTSMLSARIMRARSHREPDGTWPSVAQQYADVFTDLITTGVGPVATEIVLHVRGDGATLDDGTPIPGTVVERIAPTSVLRAMIHDTERKPINASGRHRHPTERQRRVVKERDRACVDCGRHDLLTFDHNPPFHDTRRTIVDELQTRCAPCHWQRQPPPS